MEYELGSSSNQFRLISAWLGFSSAQLQLDSIPARLDSSSACGQPYLE
jgi:hypothetical protein